MHVLLVWRNAVQVFGTITAYNTTIYGPVPPSRLRAVRIGPFRFQAGLVQDDQTWLSLVSFGSLHVCFWCARFLRYQAKWLTGKSVSEMTHFCVEWDVKPQPSQSVNAQALIIPWYFDIDFLHISRCHARINAGVRSVRCQHTSAMALYTCTYMSYSEQCLTLPDRNVTLVYTAYAGKWIDS